MSETYTVRLVDGQAFGPADLETIKSWASQGRVPASATLEPVDGGGGGGDPIVAGEHPELAGAINAPPTVGGVVGAGEPVGDATGGVIPYKNPAALVSYYLGIASLIGVVLWGIGLLISVPALILGIKGLRAYRREPRLRGQAHAWIGILTGGFFTLAHLTVIAVVVIAIVTESGNGP